MFWLSTDFMYASFAVTLLMKSNGPGTIHVSDKPRHSDSNGGVERRNRTTDEKFSNLMHDNNAVFHSSSLDVIHKIIKVSTVGHHMIWHFAEIHKYAFLTCTFLLGCWVTWGMHWMLIMHWALILMYHLKHLSLVIWQHHLLIQLHHHLLRMPIMNKPPKHLLIQSHCHLLERLFQYSNYLQTERMLENLARKWTVI